MEMMINAKSWGDTWFSMTLSERKDLLTINNEWRAKKYQPVSSKRGILRLILTDAYRAKKNDVVEDIYNTILTMGYNNTNALDHYEYSLLWIESEMKEGFYSDEYWLSKSIAEYYRDINKDLNKAIEYYKKAYFLIPKLEEEGREAKGIKYYYLSGILLCYTLVDNKQFEESRRWERDMLEKGYYTKDEGRLIMLNYERLNQEVSTLSKEGKVLTDFQDIQFFEDRNLKDYAANAYKIVAYQYYKQGDYNRAKELYEKAYYYNPKLAGVESKLKAVKKKLGEE